MGGAKPLRVLAGRRLLAHACDWAKRQGEPCAIAVRDAAQVPAAPLLLLTDSHPGIGPVSALLSAMRFARDQGCEAVLLAGCDQPFLPADLAVTLRARIGDHAVAMPVSGGKDQPLASLWRLHEDTVAQFIAQGGRSLWRLADRLGVVRVAWGSAPGAIDPFANINDPASLARLERLATDDQMKGDTPCA
jgi:molybdopterin-guanine dinucleotide biosynthesis protein A